MTMSSTPLQPPPTVRKSRVLAALDNPGFLNPIATPPPVAAPRRTPFKRSDSTPPPILDASTALALVGLHSHQKRKTSGPEDDFDFGSDSDSDFGRRGERGLTRPFNLNYDRETAVRSIDRGGPDQDMKMAEFVSQAIDNAAHNLTVQKAREKLGLNDSKHLLPGMEVQLLPHQVIGVSWMLDQERVSPHKGGILADDMGLGKTVQMIATMVMNQPTEEKENHRSTLIVVPAALLAQWKEELETRTNDMFEVHIQHGKDKIRSADKLSEKDVVITTYHTLNLDAGIPNDVKSDDELDWLQDNGGPMARVKWYRIILDEAQFVRNRGTQCSKAVAMLRAKYRWCLTGTPVTNTLADIYGYLRFGKFRPYNDWVDFNRDVAKVQTQDAQLAGLRAQGILKPLLLRRTKDAELEGEPILKLPPKHVDLVYVEFSKDERELYDMFEKSAQIQINRYIRNNSLLKHAQHVLVLILRLRQVCAHPSLVIDDDGGFEEANFMLGATADEKELKRAVKEMGAKWVNGVKDEFLKRARDYELGNDDAVEPSCPKCGDLFLEESGRILACGHEICADCLENLVHENIDHNGIFGNNDEKENLRIEKAFEEAAAKGLRPCPTCKKMQDLRPKRVFAATAFMPSREDVRAAAKMQKQTKERAHSPPQKKRRVISMSDLDSSSDSDSDDMPDLSTLLRSSPKMEKKDVKGKSKSRPAAKRTAKGKVVKKSESDSDNMGSSADSSGESSDSEAGPSTRRNGRAAKATKGKGKAKSKPEKTPSAPDMAQYGAWREGGTNVEASAKMLQMVEYLKEWEALGDKTIVFSQWTSMLDLCEQIFARHGIRSLRYDGSMGREAREYCLAEFRRAVGPKVILVSIKCGGVGLNLVSANRVINLDLAWNYATESQAYDRVHRLGQEKEVFVKRLIIRDTIEDRMLTLQDTKLGLAEAALGEGTGTRLQKLSVKQIKTLFGMYSNKEKKERQRAKELKEEEEHSE